MAYDVSSLYLGYDAWKQWGEPFHYSAEQAESFAGEFRALPLRGRHVFEVGFGKGSFLAWARDRGAIVCGSEMVPSSIEAAKQQGIEPLPADFERVADQHKDRFDLIVAFDVFEHFAWPDVVSRLTAAAIMLKPGGHVLLRFPNAQSPFGLTPQYGDATHLCGLSRGKIEQAVQGTALKIVQYDNAFRPLGRSPAKAAVRALRYAVRGMLRALINFAYATDTPLDPVVTICLRRGDA